MYVNGVYYLLIYLFACFSLYSWHRFSDANLEHWKWRAASLYSISHECGQITQPRSCSLLLRGMGRQRRHAWTVVWCRGLNLFLLILRWKEWCLHQTICVIKKKKNCSSYTNHLQIFWQFRTVMKKSNSTATQKLYNLWSKWTSKSQMHVIGIRHSLISIMGLIYVALPTIILLLTQGIIKL